MKLLKSLLIITILFSSAAFSREVVLQKMTYTNSNGIKYTQKLSVGIEDIKASPMHDPEKSQVPLSIKDAVELAKKSYLKHFPNRNFYLVDVVLRRFPDYFHRDKWVYVLNVVNDPIDHYDTAVYFAVLLNGKVIMSNSNQ